MVFHGCYTLALLFVHVCNNNDNSAIPENKNKKIKKFNNNTNNQAILGCVWQTRQLLA